LWRRLLQFQLKDPEPLLFHNEVVVRDGEIVSIVTSGNYGHHLGGAIGLGYVPCAGESAEGCAGLHLRNRNCRANAMRRLRRSSPSTTPARSASGCELTLLRIPWRPMDP
jgi:glycine cleavage system aminomethyltransferase T